MKPNIKYLTKKQLEFLTWVKEYYYLSKGENDLIEDTINHKYYTDVSKYTLNLLRDDFVYRFYRARDIKIWNDDMDETKMSVHQKLEELHKMFYISERKK
jgi:hypothetical protein